MQGPGDSVKVRRADEAGARLPVCVGSSVLRCRWDDRLASASALSAEVF